MAATRKAAIWSALAGVAHYASTAFGPGFYFGWYLALSALAYALILPAIASLHVRHALVRQSGAVLGTIAGAGVVTIGLGATAHSAFLPAILAVSGVWWWTIGKMWAETGTLPRAFGWITMLLAVACFALLGGYAATAISLSPPDLPLRLMLAAWLIVLGALLWRSAR